MTRKDFSRVGLYVTVALGVLISANACEELGIDSSRWKVVSRTNPETEPKSWVSVVLEHGGHKYHARCNNHKAVSLKGPVYGCGLHVGATIDCEWFRNRENSKGYKGYDLICGDKRNPAGELDTFAENELLDIVTEEQ